MSRLFAILLAAAMSAVPGVAAAIQDDGNVVIADGHVDLGPRFVDGEWRIQLKDDTGDEPVWRELDTVVLHGVDAARATVPDTGFEFLGDPGAEVWIIPQAQTVGILWPGWNTQDESVVTAVDGPVTWTLHGSQGPGDLVLFLTESFGEPRILFDTKEPFPQQMSIEMGTHVHGNWAYDAPGIYHLDIEMAARATDGTPVSDRRTLAFAVGDVDGSTGFPEPPGTSTRVSDALADTAPPTTPPVPDTANQSSPPEGTGTDGVPILLGISLAIGAGAIGGLVFRLRRNRRSNRSRTP